ncbi:hypothetical protein MOQ_009424 [Trypanosoma cruzi marinkellei]|uniref:Uncharacterized protein n=1 Tax=Trypanosoma cruzi marinkellei TaxID=85056 RepID=K2LVV9_TRYCR|nr:hypothetical protein MOQ_009424 [Trypanosoma cruzi marinkellei]
MLTPSRGPVASDTPFFGVVTNTLAGDILITSRRLQVLSYVLAELSSSAMLLDDYVRGILNIPHRLIVAWQSIAVAARARQATHRSKGSGTLRETPQFGGRRETLAPRTPAGRRDHNNASIGGASPQLSEQNTNNNQDVDDNRTARLHACRLMEDNAARHVEFIRRTVVMALFQQYLQVVVEKSMDDLLLRGWLGSGFEPNTRASSRGHVSRHERAESSLLDLKNGEGDEVGGNDEVGNPANGNKRPRDVSVFPLRQLLRLNVSSDHDDDDDKYVRSSVSLQAFMRAAVAFNPTICALRLMSRCILYARHVRNVDDEAAASAGTTEGEKGVFYVVVASRAVGACEHSELCFGNRKFFFVRCQESQMRCKRDGSASAQWAEAAALSPTWRGPNLRQDANRHKSSAVPRGREAWHWMMRLLTQAMTGQQPGQGNIPVRDCGGNQTRPCVPWRRSTQHPSACRTREGRSQLGPPRVVPVAARGGGGGAATVKGGTRPKGCRGFLRSFQLHRKAGKRGARDGFPNRHYHYAEEDYEEDPIESWLVMHSNRCSATGTFFAPATARPGRMITNADKPLGGLSFDPSVACSAKSFVMPFDQAISAPPNAGHDTNYREQQSTEQFTATTEVVSAGQLAFAEELLARLNFWCARGQPRRCYYDPALGDGCQTSTVNPTEEMRMDRGHGIVGSNHTDVDCKGGMPLKLLFTQVGVIQFCPVEASVYRSGRGQQLLLQALADSTEVVICSVLESRSYHGWHNHSSGGKEGRADGCYAFDAYAVSEDDNDPFLWGRYDDIAMEASVSWAQGEVTTDGADDVCDTDGNGVPTAGNLPTPHVATRRSLSMREKHQRKNERLKIEFHLAHSQRLDALLVDQRTAKPVAALILRQLPRKPHHTTGAGKQLVQETTFIVQSFSHYVVNLLRQLREENVLMVDMDRTLVDNAILAGEDSTPMACQKVNGEKGGGQLHFEVRKEVQYLVTDTPFQGMRTETIYVRHGVRRFLRCFAIEWGIPVVLVTKSSRRRTEAILSQALDPEEELFPPGYGRVFTAELLLGKSSDDLPSDGSFSSSSSSALPPLVASEKEHARWRLHESLVNSRKCTTAVLQELDRAQRKRLGTRYFSPKARSVAVLDDAPQVWVEADWPCTVSVVPYTLGRVDPREYFTPNGLITSMLLSVLYRGKGVRCPTPHREGNESTYDVGAVKKGIGRYDTTGMEFTIPALERCVFFGDGYPNNDVNQNNLLEIPRVEGSCLPEDHLLSAASSGYNASAEYEVASGEETVVEEVNERREGGSPWATADVEDVTPL